MLVVGVEGKEKHKQKGEEVWKMEGTRDMDICESVQERREIGLAMDKC